jgi:omega-6 fatty acid desaturase (delta-12 desaturase)
MSDTTPDSGNPETGALHRDKVARWKAIVAEHEKPRFWRASWQILTTVGGYLALWCLMYLSLSVSWWLTLPLAILAGAMLVRVFIIFHDCGHGSFFKSPAANRAWGRVTGLLTFTPFAYWKWEHDAHHGASGHLNRRGTGDIWTLTVEEYLQASRWKKFAYRLARNPFVLFGFAPLYLFLVHNRFPHPQTKRKGRASIWLTNLALAGLVAAQIAVFGWLPWLIIQLTVFGVAGSAGVWLFYVQHQFEDTYWESGGNWDYTEAALKGSSFYKLPRVLQWFSGNIGFHHIHHLSPRIPNYQLEHCHLSQPMFSEVKPLTLAASLRTIHLHLWDESASRLIGFCQLRNSSR